MVLISIALVTDRSLARKGKHTLHAYLPATEPFEIWQELKQGTPEYAKVEDKRSQVLWKAVVKVIPNTRKRTEIESLRALVVFGKGINAELTISAKPRRRTQPLDFFQTG